MKTIQNICELRGSLETCVYIFRMKNEDYIYIISSQFNAG